MANCDSSEDSAVLSDGILALLVMLFLSILGGHFLRARQSTLMTEAGLATLIGLGFGAAIRILGINDSLVPVTRLNVEFFLLFLLPPIIFESGYNLDKPLFFREFGGILMLAFPGTLISAFTIGSLTYLISFLEAVPDFTYAEALAFGTLISSTDPVAMLSIMKDMAVDPVLYNLVFGESIFNDAVTIVLYRAIVDNKKTGSNAAVIFESVFLFFINFIVSFFVGAAVALFIAFVLKKVSHVSSNRYNLEATAIILGPWVCYLISEALSMSGIVSALFCGIFMARYAQPNLSDMSRAMVGRAYSVVAHASETLVFIFLGIGLFSFDLPFKKTGVLLTVGSIVFCLIGRALNVLANCTLLNQFRSHKLSMKMQFVLWFGGLRGAIAFALAVQATHDFSQGEVMLTLALVFSLLSILIFGSAMTSVLRSLELFNNSGNLMDQGDTSHCFMKGKNFVAWLDETYIYPFFVHESFPQVLASPKFHHESRGEAGIELKVDPSGSPRDIEVEVIAD
mmetsp:Transcript_7994/g.15719  ORF Transcript_7994/g.15719 Transcript_7994/m.15719 type:complete len:510 (+) Transcript_7994:1974-3503(+)